MANNWIIIDPSSGEQLHTVESVEFEVIDRWLDEMARLHRTKQTLLRYRRVEILQTARLEVAERFDELAILIAAMGGRPLTDVRVQVSRTISGFDVTVAGILTEEGRQISLDLAARNSDRIAFTKHEPIGPLIAISVFNQPFNLTVDQVISAVAAACPVIVKPSKGAICHSGQVCVSVQRIFVPRSITSDFAEAFAAAAGELVTGDAKDAKTECGSMIRPVEVDRMAEWMSASSWKALCASARLSEKFCSPAVLFSAALKDDVTRQQIFDLAARVYSCDSAEKAIIHAKELRLIFQAPAFPYRLCFVTRAINELDATTVIANDNKASRVERMHFGERCHSAYGMGGISNSIREMSVEKLSVMRA